MKIDSFKLISGAFKEAIDLISYPLDQLDISLEHAFETVVIRTLFKYVSSMVF